MAEMRFVFEVEKAREAEEGRAATGTVYRSVLARDGFPPPADGMESCWDVFRISAEKYPGNRMLGHREIVNGKPGKYVWLTYKEVHDIVVKVGLSIHSCGVEQGGRCGIYGANCPEWLISMEACNAYGIYCVPLYDTLGAGAVEFIICHAEVSIAFVEEMKIPEGEDKLFELPVKKKSDICTIMYTSGTTGDPKGVMISNNSIITIIDGVKRFLQNVNEQLTEDDVYLSYLPLAHIFDRVIEESFISRGASIGFWRGDVKLLTEDLGELKPTIFCAVPRVLDRIYTETMSGPAIICHIVDQPLKIGLTLAGPVVIGMAAGFAGSAAAELVATTWLVAVAQLIAWVGPEPETAAGHAVDMLLVE
ncbi:hypothetical protein AAC387_Pa10g0314 [Persea americana]